MSKVLARVIGITLLIQVFAFFIGVGNNVILSRWLGPELLGVYATIIVIIELTLRIVNPGLDTSAIYYLSNKRFNFKNYISTYFTNGIFVFIVGLLLLLLLHNLKHLYSFSDAINLNFFNENFYGIVIYFFAFFFYSFGIAIPLGLQDFKSYNKIQMLRPFILFVLLISGAYYLSPDLSIVTGLVGASFLIPALFYWKLALPFKINWDKKITMESVKYGFKVMIGNLIQFFNYRADIILIGFFLSETEVGWYYVSVMIAERLLFLTQATATVLLPAASSSEEQREKTPLLSRINFTIVLLGSVMIGATAYWIVPLLFSAVFTNSILPLILILPGIINLSVSKLLSADLAGRGLPQYSLYVSILNFVLNVALNLVLIPNIGITGAAISSSISYTAALILQTYFYKKITNISTIELLLLKKGDLKKIRFV